MLSHKLERVLGTMSVTGHDGAILWGAFHLLYANEVESKSAQSSNSLVISVFRQKFCELHKASQTDSLGDVPVVVQSFPSRWHFAAPLQ